MNATIKLVTHKKRVNVLKARIKTLESVLKQVCVMSDMSSRIRGFVKANTGLWWPTK